MTNVLDRVRIVRGGGGGEGSIKVGLYCTTHIVSVSLYSVANVRPNKGYASDSGLDALDFLEKIFIMFKN
jgi:hypothetical protein